MNRPKPSSLSTYLGGRPHLPAVVAMSQHSEKMAPLWTDSSNLGRERDDMRSFLHSTSAPLPSPAPTSTPRPPNGTAVPSEDKMPDGRGKASHPCRSPFLFRGLAHLPTTCISCPTTFETTLTFPV